MSVPSGARIYYDTFKPIDKDVLARFTNVELNQGVILVDITDGNGILLDNHKIGSYAFCRLPNLKNITVRGKNFSAGEDVVGNVALGTIYSYDGLLCMSAKVGTVHNHHKTYALLNCPRKRVLKNGEFIVPKHIQTLASYSVNNNSNIRSIVEEQYKGVKTIMRHTMNDLPNLNNIGFKTTGVIKSSSMCNCGVTSIRK